ncbi:hypothetical protein DFQ27_009706 [Actinomortierella ambigua]|uniref:Amidase domain-containing protein n=1 Tax=Actinomortierella ambigua TaxID=1343610 RepID=A0A9P6QH41_9FUNG|nr:hypothetical protein DFQ27_009706 [Actinomortierella ambigua]
MTYDLKDPATPILRGRLLVAAVNVLERVGGATGLSWFLCRDAGLHCLRAIDYTEGLTTSPVWPPAENMVKAAAVNESTLSSDGYLKLVQDEADAEVNGGAGSESSTASSGNWRFLSCRDFYKVYRSGRTTPVEIAEQLVGLIKKSDEDSPPLRAMWSWDKELILEQARASAKRYKDGQPLSIVDGVPVVVKDEVDVQGYETGVGTTFLNKGKPALEDAHFVAQLRAHGALIIGKSTMHEIGLGITNCNPSTCTPRNPYHVDHHTGGSSGGSGAAVGAGLCPIAIGCDGGGSVRIPSSLCGIYGLKPTHGRVSSRGEYPLAPTVAVSGPMCATMEDLAIVYAIIAGKDGHDSFSLYQPNVALPKPVSTPRALDGLRIGVYRRWFEDVTQKEVAAKCYDMLDRLVQHHGAVLVDIEIPELFQSGKAHNITIVTEMLTKLNDHRNKLNHQSRLEMAMMSSLETRDYVKAQQQRTRDIQFLKKLFGLRKAVPGEESEVPVVDVIATPTIAKLPTRIHPDALHFGESNYRNTAKVMQFMMQANFTGIPGITAVAGYSSETAKDSSGVSTAADYESGLPIGIHFMSQWWDEKRLIQIGAICEQELAKAGGRQKPRLWLGQYAL